jgi:hypothetical protein
MRELGTRSRTSQGRGVGERIVDTFGHRHDVPLHLFNFGAPSIEISEKSAEIGSERMTNSLFECRPNSKACEVPSLCSASPARRSKATGLPFNASRCGRSLSYSRWS